MPQDLRVDAYVARCAPFARPILEHLRARVHAACPAAEETIKWGMPSFVYKGAILCHLAAFKAHASFGFWRGSEVTGDAGTSDEGMGQFGRLTSIADLPDDATLDALIAKAAAIIDSGAKAPRPFKHAKSPIAMPRDLRAALDTDSVAAATFGRLPPSQQRDYLEWIVGAKRPETRVQRIAQAVAWLAEGKPRNWKYMSC